MGLTWFFTRGKSVGVTIGMIANAVVATIFENFGKTISVELEEIDFFLKSFPYKRFSDDCYFSIHRPEKDKWS